MDYLNWQGEIKRNGGRGGYVVTWKSPWGNRRASALVRHHWNKITILGEEWCAVNMEPQDSIASMGFFPRKEYLCSWPWNLGLALTNGKPALASSSPWAGCLWPLGSPSAPLTQAVMPADPLLAGLLCWLSSPTTICFRLRASWRS